MNSNDILVQVNGLNTKIQNAEAGDPDPTSASVVVAHGSTGTALKPLAVDANGHLEVNFTDEGGLATEANQTTIINASVRDINNTGAIGDGSSQFSAMCLGYDRSGGQGRSILVDSGGKVETNTSLTAGHGLATETKQSDMITLLTDGTQVCQVTGNTEGDGSGDIKHLHLDGNGNVNAQIISSVNTLPANSANSGITNDPADSYAVGLRGRTDIADAATETFLLSDSSGHLQVDVVSGNVTTSISDVVIKGNDAADGSGTDRTILTDGNGALIVDASKEGLVSANGTTQALHTMMLATNDGTNLRTLACDANGVLSVDGSASTQPVSASSLPLPSGASTSALQTTGNNSLATIAGDTTSIDGKITACNTGAVVVSSSALPSGAATEATLSNAEGHLGTIDTSTAGIVASHYADGDAIGGTDTGVLVMGRNGTNTAKPIHITNNGDVEVEIADFVKGQATKANSFPVVIASDQDTLAVEQTYTYGSEYTIINAQTIANGDTVTSGEFEIQSVKNIQAILSLSVSAGGSTNFDIGFEGSLNGSDFYEFPDSTIFASGDAIVSTEKASIVPVRYMKVKITNNHGSGSHTFTIKGSVLGATLAAP